MEPGVEARAMCETEGSVLPRVARAPQTAIGSAWRGPEEAQADRALETCDGKSNDPSWSDVLDRFIEYSREVNGVCTSAPNMTEHRWHEGCSENRRGTAKGDRKRQTTKG